MADTTLANGLVTDAVTQAQVQVLGAAPAHATGALYQAMAQSLALSMQNAVANQQHMNAIGTALTSQCVALIASIPTAADTRAVNAMLVQQELVSAIRDLRSMVQSLTRTDQVPGR
ncbi:RebB family R body protein [Rhodocista pekingensis]|uniref:RebB family R body protein n=1 Tax=Rhodocista pekingensis TaxID=201185 RepID=A0ABW2KTZ8_9PROT